MPSFESDIAIVEHIAGLSKFSKQNATKVVKAVTKHLQKSDEFGAVALSRPSRDLAAYIAYTLIGADNKALREVNQSIRAAIKEAILLLADLYETDLVESGSDKADLRKLAKALEKLAKTKKVQVAVGVDGSVSKRSLERCVVAVKAGLRTKIERARRALQGAAFIDLRGCDVGSDPAELLAPIAKLFGVPDVNVSGPKVLIGFWPISSALPTSWEYENLPPTTDIRWATDVLESEARRMGIPDKWSIRIVDQPPRIERWSDLDDRIRIAIYCDVAFALVGIDGSKQAKVFLGQVGYMPNADTSLARKVLLRSLWANAPEKTVNGIVKAWQGGAIPAIPTMLLDSSTRRTADAYHDVFPWHALFSEQIVTGGD